MILSDLLIINHKGEVNKSLEKIINSCQFVVKNINKESLGTDVSQNCKPGRTVVALRDIKLNDESSDPKKMRIV